MPRADPEGTGTVVKISTQSMEAAADVLASLATALNVQELASISEFPEIVTEIQAALVGVETCKEAKLKMHTDAAAATGVIKALVCRCIKPLHHAVLR